MAYKLTIDFKPGKYPFAMNTEADQIVMTLSELEALHTECEKALLEFDNWEMAQGQSAIRRLHEAYHAYANENVPDGQEDWPEHKMDGYAERMYEMADMRRKAERENG